MNSDISLRPITYDDTALIVKWRNQDDVRSRFFYREEFTEATHLEWMKTKVESGEVVQFIIVRSDGVAIGSTYLRDIDRVAGTAEYGVFIGDPSMRGHGVGKKALALTLDYARDTLGLKRIISRAMEDNIASVNSFLHSGFKIDEHVSNVPCSNGELKDMVLMSTEI